MTWLCKIGIHSWECLGMVGLLLDSSLKRCRRCGIGHMDMCWGQAYCRYSAEELKLLLDAAVKR